MALWLHIVRRCRGSLMGGRRWGLTAPAGRPQLPSHREIGHLCATTWNEPFQVKSTWEDDFEGDLIDDAKVERLSWECTLHCHNTLTITP